MSKELAIREQQKKEIGSVQAALEQMKGQFAMALPDHIKPERMIRVALTAVQNTPKLLECNRNSFFLAVLRAAQLGLEPDGILGQAYLIPYGGEVQLIVGYKGLIDLARRSGEVSNVIAREVYHGDHFIVDWSKEIPFEHKPKLDGDRGEVKYFWALARFKDGGFHWDYMTVAEVLKVRDRSSGYKAAVAWSKNSKNQKTQGQIISPWEQDFIEMGKKTAIRRISKYLPMSVQRAALIEDLVDSGKKFRADDFGEIILEQDDPTDIIEGTATEEPKPSRVQVLKEKIKTPEAKVPQKLSPQEEEEHPSQRFGREFLGELLSVSSKEDLDFVIRRSQANLSGLQNVAPDEYNKLQEAIDAKRKEFK